MKKWSIWLTCVLVAVMMIAGLGVIAAEYGSQSDPLVTLSYIEKVLLPNAQKDVDKTVSNAMEEFEDALSDSDKTIQSYIDKKLRSFASGDVDEELIDAIAASVLEQAGGSVTAGEVSWSAPFPAIITSGL